jgi:hypothetical protein
VIGRTLTMAFTLALAAGCGSPIVGAECAAGYELCGRACVPAGECAPDAGVDFGMTDLGMADLGEGDMRPGPMDGAVDATRPDFGPPPECACNVGERCCDGLCVGTDFEPTDCGACGVTCDPGDVCSDGTCAPACGPGLTLCGGFCRDLTSDPNHCGSCGNACESGICIDGMCSVGFPGHVVLVGHNYRMSREGQNRVAGNAVFTSFANEPRVVAYRGAARPSWVRGVDDAIDQVASARGGSWTKSEVDAADVPFALADADVFLIYPQADGPTDDELRTIAALWSVALDTFTRRSGVVVAFDGGGDHGGTWQMLAAANLLDAGGRSEISGDELDLADPSDTIAFGVPVRYVAEPDSVRFDSADGAETVITHPDGPVVVHRTILPGP